MEEEKSRDVLYAKLRKKIENMGVYSFSETDTTKKHLPQYNPSSVEIKDDSFKPRIKKNTLSLTIDELIKEHEQYNSKEQQKEIKRRFSKQNKNNDQNTLIKVVWIITILVLVAGIAFIVVYLLMNGGNK